MNTETGADDISVSPELTAFLDALEHGREATDDRKNAAIVGIALEKFIDARIQSYFDRTRNTA